MPLRNDDRDGLRRCRDCNEWKPLAEFHKNKRTRAAKERLYGGNREYHLRRRYGIGEKEFRELLAAQGGVCAICGAADPEHVDHDHRTGYLRGILCFNCNGGLGQFRDNVGYLNQAVDYLRATACLVPEYPYPGVYRVRTPRPGMRPVRRGDERGRGAATSLAID